MSETKAPPAFKWMPLDMGRFIQETAMLNPTEQIAYLKLKYQYWVYGPLPNDPERLANIAGMPVDAWSIAWSNAYASLKHRFFLGPDGLLHHIGDDQERLKFLDKRLKAKEKARKAAVARWDKQKAKTNTPSNAPSIAPSNAQAIPGAPTGLEAKASTKAIPPPTPSAPRRGLESEPRPGPGEILATQPEAPASNSSPSGNGQSAKKAKPSIFAPGRAGKGSNGSEPHPTPTNGVAVHRHLAPRINLAVVGQQETDFRQETFRSEILEFWKGLNPTHPDYPWRAADRRALDELLKGNADLSIDRFRRLLHNRAASEVNPAALPYKWLRDILSFSNGPIDRFGKPLRPARQM